MSTENIKEIFCEEMKNYVVSSKSCRFDGQNYIMESKFGKLYLDFSSLNHDKITIHVRRFSGSGKFIIKTDNEEVSYSVLSKVSQSIDLHCVGKFGIIRDDSLGEICILGFTIYSEQINLESELSNRWKTILQKCESYSGIRLVNDKLFASENASIISNNLQEIETNPHGAWVKEKDRVKFLASCQIIKLVLDGGLVGKQPLQMYKHREGPTPILSPRNVNKMDTNNNSNNGNSTILPENNTYVESVYIWDSSINNGLSKVSVGAGKLVKTHLSNGKSIISIASKGVLNIPISNLSSNKKYVLAINAKKLSGSGYTKFSLISNNNTFSNFETIALNDKENYEHHIILSTDSNADTSYSLQISLPGGVGEILLFRIRIISYTDDYKKKIFKQHVQVESKPNNILVHSNKKFVIVIPSYNNSKWCEKNILSALNQDYDNFRIIFTDDCSKDDTFEKVRAVVEASENKDKATIIKNTQRIGALANLYNMIHSCEDDEIILTLDGDDWLAHDHVLNMLNRTYADDVWLTYGQYQNWPDGGKGIAQPIPYNVIANNSFRQYTWCASHLRTFYAWLFKAIKLEDFKYNGSFMSMAWDMTIMFPMLEMAGSRSRYINDFLYTYNLENPINDHKVDQKLQQTLDRYVRGMPKYQKLNYPKINKKSVGLLIIATGKYHEFIQGLISSADNYFLKDHNVTYYLFTDQDNKIYTERPVIRVPITHRPFPYASMDRFSHFNKNADLLNKEEYLYYIDVDCLLVDHVSTEIFGNLVGVQHCGYVDMVGPLENNSKSMFYSNESDMKQYTCYFGGGFSGGKSQHYLKLAKWCDENITKDINNGIMPRWHDETALNKYFIDNPPDVVLSPAYHYPMGNLNHYRSIWKKNYNPKITLLEKNHEAIRK